MPNHLELNLLNLLMQSPFAFAILKGKDSIITLANDSIKRVWGKGNDVEGKSLFDVLPEVTSQGFPELIAAVYATGVPFVGEEMLVNLLRGGKLTDAYFNFTYEPYRETDGVISGVTIIAYEVTTQTKLNQKVKESEMYFRLIAESMPEKISNSNVEGRITFYNKSWTNYTGATLETLINEGWQKWMHPEEVEQIGQKWLKSVGNGGDFEMEMRILNQEGTYRWHRSRAQRVEDSNGDFKLWIGSSTDIHDQKESMTALENAVNEQKRIEKELTEAKISAEKAAKTAELATKIAKEATKTAQEATKNAENLRIIAEDATKAKQQFLSNMSHEIRTPMNAIIGFTKVMLKTELTAKQKEYLTAVKMSGDALIVLINDILDLAKVDAGKMTFENTPFKMALSINAMLHLFEDKIQEKNLVLVKEYDKNIPEVLLGDAVRLHQIILNLISNAVKFTTEGQIKVSVKMMAEDAEKVTIRFAVTDTGIGISEDKIASIFDNFQQAAQDTPRLYGGTGLGLAIVKQLVEPQGGKISVESKITEGSVFSFVLDFEKTNETAFFEAEIMELDPDIKNIKVLVVEDMALNQLLMKTILDDFGFDRDIAENGKIAIEKLQQKDAFGAIKAYDAILMDLQMPEMNGFKATEYIRNTLKLKTPIIALTADVTTADLAKCKAVGMNDYIAKPVDERLLYSKIVNLVKKKTTMKTANREIELGQVVKLRCTNMTYLMQRTKSNPELMSAMIDAYLEQTPPLIEAMTQSFQERNWDMLHAAVHKMMPSFLIMGIDNNFEMMAKKVMEYAKAQQEADDTENFVAQLADVCTRACDELKAELNNFKKK